MIPLRDINPRYSTPFVTVLLIAANIAVFVYQFSLGPRTGESFIFTYGMVPSRFTIALEAAAIPAAVIPFFTSMFLHGGVMHLLGNMWFLWVFGDNVEDRMGHFRYLVFYLLCGVGAGLAHALLNLNSAIPAVGASGAISGVLGAYLVLFPGTRVVTLVPLIFFFFTVQIPAVVMLGYWFFLQFASGIFNIGARGGGTAWWAHIGGFAIGFVWVMIFRPRQRRPSVVTPW